MNLTDNGNHIRTDPALAEVGYLFVRRSATISLVQADYNKIICLGPTFITYAKRKASLGRNFIQITLMH